MTYKELAPVLALMPNEFTSADFYSALERLEIDIPKSSVYKFLVYNASQKEPKAGITGIWVNTPPTNTLPKSLNIKELFSNTLGKMPPVFSSTEFGAKIKETVGASVAYRLATNSAYRRFLERSCIRISDRMYQKRETRKAAPKTVAELYDMPLNTVAGNVPEPVVKVAPMTEEYCIKFLKERGYKIMRPVAQFEEV